MDRLAQLGQIDRFGEEIPNAQLLNHLWSVNAAKTAGQQYWQAGFIRYHRQCQIHSSHVGHGQIGDHQIETSGVSAEQCQRLAWIGDYGRLISQFVEHAAECGA